MKKIAILALLVALILSGCINQTQSNTTKTALTTAVQAGGLRQAELSIKGLWCESCVYGIQSIMTQTPGIQSAEIRITDYAAQTGAAKIVYDSTRISSQQIAKLTQPYQSTIINDGPIA